LNGHIAFAWQEKEPTKFEKEFATAMGAITSACAGPIAGAAVKWFITWEEWSGRYYRKDTGEYI
jgi:hypothetical protein